FLIEIDVVEDLQARWWAHALEWSADHRKDTLVESCRLLHLPCADFGARRTRRDHEYNCVRIADQVAEASFPVLAAGNVVTVDEALEAASIKRRVELVREDQVVAAVGDEDAKLTPVGQVGPARLFQRDATRFRRSRAGCVMCNVCHCEAPPCRLTANISTSFQCVRAGIISPCVRWETMKTKSADMYDF